MGVEEEKKGVGQKGSNKSGIIFTFAKHRNAANLVLFLMVLGGVFGLLKLNSQFLPSFGIDVITVTVEWPGATADDVDVNVVQSIEPEVRFLDRVKRVKSSAYPGLARIRIEFEAGSDMQAALSDVTAGISRLRTLPDDCKKPEISRIVRYETLMRIALSGNYSESALKSFGKRVRDGLLARGIDKVDFTGTRNEEIIVEVPSGVLRRLDLKLSEIASKIRETSQDLPSGDIAGGTRQVRSLGLQTDAAGIGNVEIKALKDGRKIYLRDIAAVREGFQDKGVLVKAGNESGIELHVQRGASTDALTKTRVAEEYLKEAKKVLPSHLKIETYDVATDLLRDRINLLIKNGISGLLIVILILMVFLRGRIAFWIMLGIPASLLATFGFMLATDQTVNMVSLFALIMTIGIIVDDAIVVGEHTDTQSYYSKTALEASVIGAQRMAIPVWCAALTTISAFLPLFLISGIIGQIIAAIPMVVIAVIVASLVECFFVLPGHLRGAIAKNKNNTSEIFLFSTYRAWFDKNFQSFRETFFRRLVCLSLEWRYTTIVIALGLFVLSIGLVIGGRVGFSFFPAPESDKIFANVEMFPSSTRADTEEMVLELSRALYMAAERFEGKESDLVKIAITKIGTFVGQGPGMGDGSTIDNRGGLTIELRTADTREVRTQEFIDVWRKEIKPKTGLYNLTIREARGGPPGRDIDIRFIGRNLANLKNSANEVKVLLKRYPGVSAIDDDLPYGKIETILEVSKRGRSLGFTTETVGRQVRNSIEGSIAKRFPRGDEEVTVRVKLPRNELDINLLEKLYLRSSNNSEVALIELVESSSNRSFSRITREDGKRQVAVTAKIDASLANTAGIISALQRDGLEEISKRYNVDVGFKGKTEERKETFGDMRIGSLIGLASIYIILAWVFSSYSQPIIVMAIIPLSFVGAVLGHWLLGFNLTILSLVALIGLAGIVVNNSIILLTTIDRRSREESIYDAIVNGACDRLRAIILTSATTIGGLTPLLFERSLQAQFLIPMAVTIVFGLGVAALLVLFVIPALIGVRLDIKNLVLKDTTPT